MTSVGIDVSKGKSTVCILRPYGEVLPRMKYRTPNQRFAHWYPISDP